MITLHKETSHNYSQTAYLGWVLQADPSGCGKMDPTSGQDEDPPLTEEESVGGTAKVIDNRAEINVYIPPFGLLVSVSFLLAQTGGGDAVIITKGGGLGHLWGAVITTSRR